MKKRQSEPATNNGRPCDQGPVSFSLETRIGHRQFKISSWKHLRNTRLLVILSSPLIYACVLPFLLLDGAVAIYQLVCFPIYGIPKVSQERLPGLRSGTTGLSEYD
jgi:hypothetical protein